MTKPIPAYTIKVWSKEQKPFHMARIRSYFIHRELGKKPILWGYFGFFLTIKETDKAIPWLKSIGFTKAEVEEC